MNKHKILIYTGSFALLIASFITWTMILRWTVAVIPASVAVFSVPHDIGVAADLEKPKQPPEISARPIVPEHAAAPVAPTSVVSVALLPQVIVTHDELSEWEINRAWGISIPSLGIRAPVLLPSMKYWSTRSWEMLERQMQTGLSYGTVAYPHSSSPGEKGSLIIAGHSSPPDERAKLSDFGAVFAKVPEILIGEEIIVSRSGKQIRYRVEFTDIVSPDTTSILVQNPDEGGILRLITCYPVGTTKSRFIVTARLVEETP